MYDKCHHHTKLRTQTVPQQEDLVAALVVQLILQYQTQSLVDNLHNWGGVRGRACSRRRVPMTRQVKADKATLWLQQCTNVSPVID